MVITGSSGRVGRALHGAPIRDHSVCGIDTTPASSTHEGADIRDPEPLLRIFEGADCEEPFVDAASVIRRRAPELARAFDSRRRELPMRIDRVYDASFAAEALNGRAERGPDEVLRQLDVQDFEVLPPQARRTDGRSA